MPPFVATSANAEISGAAVMILIEALGVDLVAPILSNYSLNVINPALWYPHQSVLDLLRDLSEQEKFNMVGVAMCVAQAFSPPSDIVTTLFNLDSVYFKMHRNLAHGYHVERIGARKLKVLSCTPYPADFQFGMIYGLVRRDRPWDSPGFSVLRDDSLTTRSSAVGNPCAYLVEW